MIICALALGSTSLAAAGYDESTRITLIESAFHELERSPDQARDLREEIRSQTRIRCQGKNKTLVVRCAVEVGRQQCEGKGSACLALADVILTNGFGEDSFVTDAERYAILNRAENFRAELDKFLVGRYAELATELALENAHDQGATMIDKFCLKVAKRNRLPWQRCVAALVWFIGTENKQ